MNFLHPEFLYLSPLVAAPILIHLLNRIRYRRQHWAAIEFLLNTERRAVRRARLRQILLMMLRTLLLAAALLALLQPVLRGGLASLLGSSSQVAVLVDASASMTSTGPFGVSFDRAKTLVSETLKTLPHGTRAGGGAFAAVLESPFRETLQDRSAVCAVLEGSHVTSGAGDVPSAIRGGSEILAAGGGGGSIWLLTDMQVSGWRTRDAGAWHEVAETLERAGRPRIVITDVAAAPESNAFVASVEVSPALLVEGDSPKITASIGFEGTGQSPTNVYLFLDGKRIDSRAVQLAGPGVADCVFYLPPITDGVHAGYLELNGDAMPGDDRYYFVLRTATDIPVLLVDGSPSTTPFEGGVDFLELGLRPVADNGSSRSPFSTTTIGTELLASTQLAEFAAIFLAEVPQIGPDAEKLLHDYVSQGGLLVVFPSSQADLRSWNESGIAGAKFASLHVVEGDDKIGITEVNRKSPVTATLPAEGLNRVRISQMFRLEAGPNGEILGTAETGDPFLVRSQVGKGKVYTFAVSCQTDFSNLPLTPVMLIAIHRMMLAHLLEAVEPVSRYAFDEVKLLLPPGSHKMLTPGGKALPLTRLENDPRRAVFRGTDQSGIYRLLSSGEDSETAAPVCAVNVPAAESQLERITEEEVRELLPGCDLSFVVAGANSETLTAGAKAQSASASFPFALLAVLFLVGEVVLGWSIGRPAARGNGEAQALHTDRSIEKR